MARPHHLLGIVRTAAMGGQADEPRHVDNQSAQAEDAGLESTKE